MRQDTRAIARALDSEIGTYWRVLNRFRKEAKDWPHGDSLLCSHCVARECAYGIKRDLQLLLSIRREGR